MPELIKYARRDIVRRGLAPQVVEQVKDALLTKDNTRGVDSKLAYTSSVQEKTAGVLFLLGEGVNYYNHEIAAAFIRVLDRVQVSYTLLREEPCSGKELELLGYRQEAKEKAGSMAKRIQATGCKSIVVSDPLSYDALKNDYPAWGLSLDAEVLHVSEYIQRLIGDGKLGLKHTGDKVTLADSEFLGRYNSIYDAPRAVIRAAAGDGFTEMQWHHSYLQATGEAAITFEGKLFDKGRELGKKISRKAEDIKADVIITLSATAKNNIAATTGLKVMDIAEFTAGLMV
ncbi:MAG: (Fe-S)-binding protein [Chitinophagaceae bacterium]|nr:(Fe-S)-binding protein [Chitinophagaceae bacterium]